MKTSKKTMLAIAVTLLLAAALFVGAGAADANGGNNAGDATPTITEVADWAGLTTAIAASESTDPEHPDQIKLTANITNGNAELNINGKFITIDGDDHTLAITHTKAKAAILISGNGGVTLKNITIVGPSSTAEPTWASGRIAVKVFGGENFFDGVTIKNGTEAILVDGSGTKLTLKGTNHFEDNLYNGIEVHNNGCELILDSGVTVTTKANPEADTNLEHAYIWVDDTAIGSSNVTTNGKAVSVTHPKADQLYWVIGGDEVAQIVVDSVPYKFASLTEAYAALYGKFSAKNNLTITLLKDYTGGGIGSDGDAVKTYTIDFGGHTYTAKAPAVGSKGYETQAFRVLQGSTAVFKNGTVKAAENSGIKQFFHTYGTVTLEDLTVDCSDNSEVGIVYEADCGILDIKGSTSILAASGKTGLYTAYWHYSTYDGTTVTVDTTGKITGKLVYEFDERSPGGVPATANKGFLYIENGNFEIDGIQTIFTPSIAQDLKTEQIYISGGSFNDFSVFKYVTSPADVTFTIDAGAADADITIPAGVTVTFAEDTTLTAEELTVDGKLIADTIAITSADTLVITGEVDVSTITPPQSLGAKFIEMQEANAKLVISDGSTMEVNAVLDWIDSVETAGAKVEKVTVDPTTGTKTTETVKFTAPYTGTEDLSKVTQKSTQKETQGGDIPASSQATVTLEADTVEYHFTIPSAIVLVPKKDGVATAPVGFTADIADPAHKIQIKLTAGTSAYVTDHYELKGVNPANIAKYQISVGPTPVASGECVVDALVTKTGVTKELTFTTQDISAVDTYTGTITFDVAKEDA